MNNENSDIIKRFPLSDLCKDCEEVIENKESCKQCIVTKLFTIE